MTDTDARRPGDNHHSFVSYRQSSAPVASGFEGPASNFLEYKIFDSIESAYEALACGNADIVDWPSNELPTDVQSQNKFNSKVFAFYQVALNFEGGCASQKNVRQGLAYIFDHVRRVYQIDNTNIELMDAIAPKSVYGRVVNPYTTTYHSSGKEDALHKALTTWKPKSDSDQSPLSDKFYLIHSSCDPISRKLITIFTDVIYGTPFADLVICKAVDEADIPSYLNGAEGRWDACLMHTHIMDNVGSWKPGLFKTRHTPHFMGDFISHFSSIRNYARMKNEEYDRYAISFLKALYPYDIRPTVLFDEHFEEAWSTEIFWKTRKSLPASTNESVIYLAWKIQEIISNEIPTIPLFMPAMIFHVGADIRGVWNAHNEQGHHGGILSYWTFQKIVNDRRGGVILAMSNKLRDLNPLAPTTYRDSLIWSRIYESLLALNPYALARQLGEDSCHLSASYEVAMAREESGGERITFLIRPDIKWHDGQAFTNKDVAFTILSVLGKDGIDIARRNASSVLLIDDLVNQVPIPGWSDWLKYTTEIDISNPATITVHVSERFRWSHEWYGDLPIIPLHIWKRFGNNFLAPTLNGAVGLSNIRLSDPHSGKETSALVGTGPFKWVDQKLDENSALSIGGRLEEFSGYHNGRNINLHRL